MAAVGSTISNNRLTSINCTNSGSTGINFTGVAGQNFSIFNNTINSLTSTFSTGINLNSNFTLANIYNNQIYDINGTTAAGIAYGIRINTGTTCNIYNNFIRDLKAALASVDNSVIGINCTSTTASSSINVYYNTIYLNATSTGTNFGSSGILHTGSATSTTATLDLRNNIIKNTSTANGT